MAKRKTKRQLDMERLDEELKNLVFTEGELNVWNKDEGEPVNARGEQLIATDDKPQRKKAFLRVLANQTLTGKNARQRDQIKQAREWYRTTTLGAKFGKRADERRAARAEVQDTPTGDRGFGTTQPDKEEPLDIPTPANEEKPPLAVDFALARGIAELTPGKAIGPTGKAARTAKARKRTAKQQVPEPGTLEWAIEQEKAKAAQEKVLSKKKGMEVKLAGIERGTSGAPVKPGRTVVGAIADWLGGSVQNTDKGRQAPSGRPASTAYTAARRIERKYGDLLSPTPPSKPKPAKPPTAKQRKRRKS